MYSALKKANTRKFKTVWHVGTMDVADKRSHSHEGNGLSVSVNPNEWAQIARLGGGGLYRLIKPAGSFLDFHKLTKAAREELLQWGLKHGWLALEPRWKVEWYDDELARTCMMLCDSQAEAQGELGVRNEEEASGVQQVEVPCMTARAAQRIGFAVPALGALDIAATLFVEDETPLDGVWWDDELDPLRYSAPRGVICLKRLSSWHIELTHCPGSPK